MTGVCLPNRNIALASLRREGVKSYINSKVLEVTEHEVKIQHKDGTEEWLKGFDYIVLGLGSRKYDPLSEELKAFVPEVHVIGDAIKPGQSSDAMHQGFHVGTSCKSAYSLCYYSFSSSYSFQSYHSAKARRMHTGGPFATLRFL